MLKLFMSADERKLDRNINFKLKIRNVRRELQRYIRELEKAKKEYVNQGVDFIARGLREDYERVRLSYKNAVVAQNAHHIRVANLENAERMRDAQAAQQTYMEGMKAVSGDINEIHKATKKSELLRGMDKATAQTEFAIDFESDVDEILNEGLHAAYPGVSEVGNEEFDSLVQSYLHVDDSEELFERIVKGESEHSQDGSAVSSTVSRV